MLKGAKAGNSPVTSKRSFISAAKCRLFVILKSVYLYTLHIILLKSVALLLCVVF